MKWYLPIWALCLAIALALLGSVQTTRYVGQSLVVDYVAPAEIVLHVINMPAAILIYATTKDGTLHIGFEYSRILLLLYLCLVALLWFLVAGRLAGGRKSFHSFNFAGKFLRVGAVVYGALMLFASVSVFGGPHALILPVASAVWGLGIIVLAL